MASYQCIDSRLLGEAADIARHHGHHERKVGCIATRENGADKAAPFVIFGKVAHQRRARNGNGHVPGHPERARVFEVGASRRG